MASRLRIDQRIRMLPPPAPRPPRCRPKANDATSAIVANMTSEPAASAAISASRGIPPPDELLVAPGADAFAVEITGGVVEVCFLVVFVVVACVRRWWRRRLWVVVECVDGVVVTVVGVVTGVVVGGGELVVLVGGGGGGGGGGFPAVA